MDKTLKILPLLALISLAIPLASQSLDLGINSEINPGFHTIYGRTTDNKTNYCKTDIQVNITGNTSGLFWTLTTYNISESGLQTGCGVTYQNLDNESTQWVSGELITVTSVNTSATGYAGNRTVTAPDPASIFLIKIDLNITDIANPLYNSIVYSSGQIRRGGSLQVNSSWRDNSGVVTAVLTHNASGIWVNDSVGLNENISTTKSVFDAGKNLTPATINTTNITRGTNVSWKIIAWDPTGNLNDTHPTQSFIVANALPQITGIQIQPTNPTSQDTLNCSPEGTDLDGDNVTYQYSWKKGNTTLTPTTKTLGVGNYSIGDNITCIAQSYDGYENGSIMNTTVTILNETIIQVITDMSSGWNLFSIPVHVS